MNAGRKLGAYGLLLAAALGGGAAVGAAVGPIDVGGSDRHDTRDTSERCDPTEPHQSGETEH